MKITHTQTEWFVKSARDDEYHNHVNYTVHGRKVNLKTKPADENSPIWEFTPHICTIEFGRTNEERKANARLIAAAPDLLEALDTAVQYIDAKRYPELMQMCEAAISKAKGE